MEEPPPDDLLNHDAADDDAERSAAFWHALKVIVVGDWYDEEAPWTTAVPEEDWDPDRDLVPFPFTLARVESTWWCGLALALVIAVSLATDGPWLQHSGYLALLGGVLADVARTAAMGVTSALACECVAMFLGFMRHHSYNIYKPFMRGAFYRLIARTCLPRSPPREIADADDEQRLDLEMHHLPSLGADLTSSAALALFDAGAVFVALVLSLTGEVAGLRTLLTSTVYMAASLRGDSLHPNWKARALWASPVVLCLILLVPETVYSAISDHVWSALTLPVPVVEEGWMSINLFSRHVPQFALQIGVAVFLYLWAFITRAKADGEAAVLRSTRDPKLTVLWWLLRAVSLHILTGTAYQITRLATDTLWTSPAADEWLVWPLQLAKPWRILGPLIQVNADSLTLVIHRGIDVLLVVAGHLLTRHVFRFLILALQPWWIQFVALGSGLTIEGSVRHLSPEYEGTLQQDTELDGRVKIRAAMAFCFGLGPYHPMCARTGRELLTAAELQLLDQPAEPADAQEPERGDGE